MDVQMSAITAQATAQNRASVGQDILLKTLEKSEESKLTTAAQEPRPVEKTQPERQGRIDLYA